MYLRDINLQKLEELRSLLRILPSDFYKMPQNILNGSTIGQHVRHILEFYTCLLEGLESGYICYDKRARDLDIEQMPTYAIEVIETIGNTLQHLDSDHSLTLELCLYTDDSESGTTKIDTSLKRELAYVFDHALHHQAIFKRLLIEHNIQLSPDFGIAASTLMAR
jgi:hypothetical protein